MSLLYLPSAFLAASECLTKDCEPGSDTWALRIAPFSTLSGKLTQPASWRRAWKKARWMRHLSGPTFAPSMQQLGMEKWISSLPDSHAKTCQSPVAASDSTASAPGSSLRLSGLPPIAVRGSSFWRTSQASLVPPPPLWTKPKALSTSARPPESWENWPTSGGIRNGSLFQRPTWAPAMAARAGSASPGAMWQTPKASEEESGSGMNSRGSKDDLMLPSMACQWPTPQAHDAVNGKTPEQVQAMRDRGHGVSNLNEFAPHWPTPMAADQRGSAGMGKAELPNKAQQWPTPAARDFKDHGAQGGATENGREITDGSISERCGLFAPGPSDPRWAGIIAAAPWIAPALDGHLNPNFVEFLMGWPIGWTQTNAREEHDLENSPARNTAQWQEVLALRLRDFFVPASRGLQQATGGCDSVPQLPPEGASGQQPERTADAGSLSSMRNDVSTEKSAAGETLRRSGLLEEMRGRRCAEAMEHRTGRLKGCGNGVVTLTAATAFVVLARRSGIFKGMKA